MKAKKKLLTMIFATVVTIFCLGLAVQAKTAKKAACKHKYAWKTTRTATCARAGEQQQVCKKCGYVLKRKAIKKKAHTYYWQNMVDYALVPVCSKCKDMRWDKEIYPPTRNKKTKKNLTEKEKWAWCYRNNGKKVKGNFTKPD